MLKENVEVRAYLSNKPLDVDDLLKKLGLYENHHKLPNQLSGDQQQRTAIGRAIVKIRTFFSAMSQPVPLITTPLKRF